MKIRSSVPVRIVWVIPAVQINRGGWGAAFLQEHKIELDKKYEKFLLKKEYFRNNGCSGRMYVGNWQCTSTRVYYTR